MFSQLRYFYLVSFLIILTGAVGVGLLIHGMMSTSLEQVVKRGNISLSQGFINSVWHTPQSSGAPPASLQQKAEIFTKELAALQFNIYDNSGRRLFASQPSRILESDGTLIHTPIGVAISNASIFHRTVKDATIENGGNAQTGQTVVQTAFPIPNPQYNAQSPICQSLLQSNDRAAMQSTSLCTPVRGMIEIIVGISGESKQLRTIQYVSTAGTIALFALMMTILYLTTMRAESIIAKQHEVNLELTAATATAEAENRDKAQFLANISHELRTPLNAIIGFSEIIKSESMEGLSASHQEYIRDIHSSGVHLLSLINDILDYSKAEAGKLELEVAEIDITKLIRNSMRLVIPRAESAQVTLVESLPAEHVISVTDGKKLKQVLLNLLSNAVKFTPPGGEVKVSVWEQLVDAKVCIEVRDTGIGIAPKDISKVMAPFGQVDSKLSRKYEGTGLGLPLSKKFVEIMGGEFLMESEVNKGTSITIKLPRLKEKGTDHSVG